MRLLAAWVFSIFCMAATPGAVHAQFDLEESHSTASLRGIDAAGPGVAWASGSGGTVRRTEDGGFLWQICTVPPGGEKLDFRAVQGFDANTALVMSSGKGGLSRVFKTTDGCQTWKEVLVNPDGAGFFDAMVFNRDVSSPTSHDGCFGVIVGDPVSGRFPMFSTYDCGDKWERQVRESPEALEGEGLFAASNSGLVVQGLSHGSFVTGGTSGARLLSFSFDSDDTCCTPDPQNGMPGAKELRLSRRRWTVEQIPVKHPSVASGAFSLGAINRSPEVVVGGDYVKPDSREGTAWFRGSGTQWATPVPLPGGYRSAVAYDAQHQAWLTVGPNGADVSFDDGRTWKPVKGRAAAGWNAISLPFVVGAKGQIGKVRDEVWAH